MNYLTTIIDREAGETLYTADTDAIIGAVSDGDGTMSLAQTSCSGSVLVNTLAAARLAVDNVLEGEPRKLREEVGRVYRKMRKLQRRDAKAARKTAKQFARFMRKWQKEKAKEGANNG